MEDISYGNIHKHARNSDNSIWATKNTVLGCVVINFLSQIIHWLQYLLIGSLLPLDISCLDTYPCS